MVTLLRDGLFNIRVLIAFASWLVANGSQHPNKVISLPGAPAHLDLSIFSGYLNGTSGSTELPIFYLLTEAIRVEPETAPLLVWFNGGPGGSSLYGCFLENGPLRVNENGTFLSYNEFSWNQYANVLYLESPLGVGFSKTRNGYSTTTNDRDAAEINYHSLRDFMMRVHPNYADRDYFLSGQSYAGIYVPYLARRLMRGIQMGDMTNRNFKGFAIGNPTFNYKTSTLAEGMRYINHGLGSNGDREAVMSSWLKHQQGIPLNDTEMSRIYRFTSDIYENYVGLGSPVQYNFNDHCYESKLLQVLDYHGPTTNKTVACYGHRAIELYMNRLDVQSALHVRNSRAEASRWTVVSREFPYEREKDVSPVYDELLKMTNGSSFRMLIYTGDVDTVKPALHASQCVAKVAEKNSLKDQQYDPLWTFYGDWAGARTGYARGNVSLDVLTVRGAGHSVPTDLPAQAFQMINNFIFTNSTTIDYSKPILKTWSRDSPNTIDEPASTSSFKVTLVIACVLLLLLICAIVFKFRKQIMQKMPSRGNFKLNFIRMEEDQQSELLDV